MWTSPNGDLRGRGFGRGRGVGWTHRGASFTQSVGVVPAPLESQQRICPIESRTMDTSMLARDKIGIKDVKYVASYNWRDGNTPTLIVPGVPPKWLPPKIQIKLRQDEGEYYRDPNAARSPQHPVEPAIRAILHCNPSFDSKSVRVFGCGNTVGCLLSFVADQSRTFRFGIELIGECLFLVRRPNTPTELIDNVYGYGHTFADACTDWEFAARGSASHQRIINYDFGGLSCLIRSECDGYLPDKVPPRTLPTTDRDSERSAADRFETSSVDNTIDDLRVSQQAIGPVAPLRLEIIRPSQRAIPQAALFDLKTRSIRKMDAIQLDEFLPRLWANQTPNFILAYHESGMFRAENIQLHDVSHEVQAWEEDHKVDLQKLKMTLDKLSELARQPGQARLEIRRSGLGPLEVWTAPDGWKALSTKWETQWLHGSLHEDDNTSSSDDESDGGVDGEEPYLRF